MEQKEREVEGGDRQTNKDRQTEKRKQECVQGEKASLNQKTEVDDKKANQKIKEREIGGERQGERER